MESSLRYKSQEKVSQRIHSFELCIDLSNITYQSFVNINTSIFLATASKSVQLVVASSKMVMKNELVLSLLRWIF